MPATDPQFIKPLSFFQSSCTTARLRKSGCLLLFVTALLLAPAGLYAQETSKTASPDDEEWDVVYMNGQRVGYGHTSSEEITGDDGKTIVVTDALSYMEIKRFGGQLTMTIQQHTEEDEEGRLLGFRFKLDNPPITSMQTVGNVNGDKLSLEMTVAGKTTAVTQDWDPEAKSPTFQDRALAEDLPEEGETRTVEMYEPSLNQIVTLTVEGHGRKTTTLLDGSKVEATSISLEMASLPATTVYVNGEGDVIKTESALAGFTVETYRVDRETALEEIGDAPLDLAVATLVPVEPIRDAFDTKRIVYRIVVAGGGAADYFAAGPTQSVKKISDDVVELTVRAIEPGTETAPAAVAGEYLESTRFLESDDRLVREHAEKAVGEKTDPTEMALAMESYVHTAMRNKNYATGLATASDVARELSGDCTEHAVLLAAMLRAKGIPSRVCVGLVYSPRHSGFAGHMWTEAYLGGTWFPLDATLGRGGIDAAHIKISDSSLAENAPTPVGAFLPMMHLLGKMKIEVVSVGTTEGTEDTEKGR